MYNPNLTCFQHSYLEKCGFLTRGVNNCCIHGTENAKITKNNFCTEKWCGNKYTKFERKRFYRREDVLFSTMCTFYSDKIITPQARFCWTLSHIVFKLCFGMLVLWFSNVLSTCTCLLTIDLPMLSPVNILLTGDNVFHFISFNYILSIF